MFDSALTRLKKPYGVEDSNGFRGGKLQVLQYGPQALFLNRDEGHGFLLLKWATPDACGGLRRKLAATLAQDATSR